jgi:hypothetical protein
MPETRHRQPDWLLDLLIVAVGAGFLIWISWSGPEAGQPPGKGLGEILGGLYVIYLGVLFLLSYFFPDRTYVLNFLRYICEECSSPAGHRYMAWCYFALCLGMGSWLLLIGLGVLF